VKLPESFKVQSSDSGAYFARALRAIGQDLNELFPHQLEIVYKETSFETQVRCDRKRAEKKSPPAEKSGLKNVFHKLATYRVDKGPEGADTATYEHSYHPEEVNRLDRAGLHRLRRVRERLPGSLRRPGRHLPDPPARAERGVPAPAHAVDPGGGRRVPCRSHQV